MLAISQMKILVLVNRVLQSPSIGKGILLVTLAVIVLCACVAADMEDLSNRVDTCSLYEEMQGINLPLYVQAFGEYALVIPPQTSLTDVPKVDLESQHTHQVH